MRQGRRTRPESYTLKGVTGGAVPVAFAADRGARGVRGFAGGAEGNAKTLWVTVCLPGRVRRPRWRESLGGSQARGGAVLGDKKGKRAGLIAQEGYSETRELGR